MPKLFRVTVDEVVQVVYEVVAENADVAAETYGHCGVEMSQDYHYTNEDTIKVEELGTVPG